MGSNTWIFIAAAYGVGFFALAGIAGSIVWRRRFLRAQQKTWQQTPDLGVNHGRG